MRRREFLRTAGGVTGAATVTAGAGPGTAAVAAQANDSGGGQQGPIDYGGWFDGVPYWGGDGSTVDARGQDEVTITVGADVNNGLSFDPAAIHVDPGTTIVWEWTGAGGAHNVVSETVPDGAMTFDSGPAVSEEGATYDAAPDTEGLYPYFCRPHLAQNMKGAVAVGEVPRKAVQSGPPTRTDPEPREMGVPIQAHWVGIATILMMVATFVFTFFLLKYGESAHTKGGN